MQGIRYTLSLSFLLTAFSNIAFGQVDSAIFAVKASFHLGFIIPHSSELKEAAEGAYPRMAELDLSWLNYSKAGWASANCYRKSGIILGYADFDKPTVLGTGSYFMVYTEPQLTYTKLSLSFTGAAGIIFLDTVYDPDSNPTNMFYSNPVSGLVRAGFSGHYRISNHFQLSLSTHFNHISNGHSRLPNYGMNFPTASLSVTYHIQPATLFPRKRITTYDPSLHYSIDVFAVQRLINPAYEEFGKEKMVGISFKLSKHFNHCSSWVAGTEISYDKSLPKTGDLFGFESSPWIASLVGGHCLSLGRTSFSQLLGVYVYKQYDNSNAVFQRYVLDYAVTKNLRVGFSLKAHVDTAELMDGRLGITF